MAGQGESSDEKTEQPTERRLEKAFQEGEIQLARDPFLFAMVLCGVGLALSAPRLAELLKGFAGYIYDAYPATGGGLMVEGRPDHILAEALRLILIGTSVGAGALLVCVIVVALALRRFRVPFREIKPSIGNVSPAKGLARLFGSEGLIRNGIGALKVVVVIAVAIWAGKPLVGPAQGFVGGSLDVDLMRRTGEALAPLAVAMLTTLALFSGADIALRFFQNQRRLRMSRHDIHEEVKEQEGDPHIKARLDRIRRDRRRSGRHSLKDADVVVTNPTHFAVALKYEDGTRRAPFVVARGAGLMAQWIMRRARRYGIPVLRYPKITRRIFFSTDIDAEIPDTVFEDVARILLLVYTMRKPAGPAGVRR